MPKRLPWLPVLWSTAPPKTRENSVKSHQRQIYPSYRSSHRTLAVSGSRKPSLHLAYQLVEMEASPETSWAIPPGTRANRGLSLSLILNEMKKVFTIEVKLGLISSLLHLTSTLITYVRVEILTTQLSAPTDNYCGVVNFSLTNFRNLSSIRFQYKKQRLLLTI